MTDLNVSHSEFERQAFTPYTRGLWNRGLGLRIGAVVVLYEVECVICGCIVVNVRLKLLPICVYNVTHLTCLKCKTEQRWRRIPADCCEYAAVSKLDLLVASRFYATRRDDDGNVYAVVLSAHMWSTSYLRQTQTIY